MRRITWRVREPDGKVTLLPADYDEHEYALVNGLVRAADEAKAAGDLDTMRERMNEVDTIHELKALFGAKLERDLDDPAAAPEPVEQTSFEYDPQTAAIPF